MNKFEEFYWLLKRLKKYKKNYIKEINEETPFNLLESKYKKKYYKKMIKNIKKELINPNIKKNIKNLKFKKYFNKKLEKFKLYENYGEFIDLTEIYKKYKIICYAKNYKNFIEKIFFIQFEINNKTIKLIEEIIDYLINYYIRKNPEKKGFLIKNIKEKDINSYNLFLIKNKKYELILKKFILILNIFSIEFINTIKRKFHIKKIKPLKDFNIFCEFCEKEFFNSKELIKHFNTKEHKSHFINIKTNKQNINNFIFKSSLKQTKSFLFKFNL